MNLNLLTGKRSFLSLALSVVMVLGGCTATPVSKNMSAASISGLGELNRIAEAARLSAYSSPSSFDIAANSYANALIFYKQAMPVDEGTSTESSIELKQLRNSVENCIESIRLMADLHRLQGLSADADELNISLSACQASTQTIGRFM